MNVDTGLDPVWHHQSVRGWFIMWNQLSYGTVCQVRLFCAIFWFLSFSIRTSSCLGQTYSTWWPCVMQSSHQRCVTSRRVYFLHWSDWWPFLSQSRSLGTEQLCWANSGRNLVQRIYSHNTSGISAPLENKPARLWMSAIPFRTVTAGCPFPRDSRQTSTRTVKKVDGSCLQHQQEGYYYVITIKTWLFDPDFIHSSANPEKLC